MRIQEFADAIKGIPLLQEQYDEAVCLMEEEYRKSIDIYSKVLKKIETI